MRHYTRDSLLPNEILSNLAYYQFKYRISEKIDLINIGKVSEEDERDALARILFSAQCTYGSSQLALIEMFLLMERAKKHPHLYPDYSPKWSEGLFGTLAQRMFKFDEKHITSALKKQKEYAKKGELVPHIGELLIEKGVIKKEQAAKVILEQK